MSFNSDDSPPPGGMDDTAVMSLEEPSPAKDSDQQPPPERRHTATSIDRVESFEPQNGVENNSGDGSQNANNNSGNAKVDEDVQSAKGGDTKPASRESSTHNNDDTGPQMPTFVNNGSFGLERTESALRRTNTVRMEMTFRKARADAPPPSAERMKKMRTFAMSRVAESLRFDIDDEEMELPVTYELLEKVVRRANNLRLHESEEVVEAQLKRLWAILDGIGPWETTFNDLLDVECPNFPETTPAQREKLRSIASECDIVTKALICRVFQVEEDSQLVEFLFSSGANALPGEVFQDIVGTLETHPYSQPFSLDFTDHMVSSGRKMMTMLPFLTLVIIVMVLLPRIANIAHHEMMRSVLTVLDDDWSNGCPNGVTSMLGCNFIQRNLNMIETVEFDALRYFRSELIEKLWNDDGRSAAFTPVGFDKDTGSTFATGSLILRLAPGLDGNDLPKSSSCDDLNLTTSTWESRVFDIYGCDAVWSALIPFNSTKDEALAKAATATATMPSAVGGALIAQFGTFEPATGVAAYFKVTLSLPKAGHVMTRIEAVPVDYESHKSVLPLMILNAITFGVSLGFGIFYSTKGRALINGDLVADFILFLLVTISYGMLKNLEEFDVYQIDHATWHHDVAANQYATAVRVLAFWVMLMIGLAARYLREVGALYIVIAIINYAALEILALVVIFGIWTLSFALMANLFFGSIAVNFASTFSAFAFLFQFFSAGGSYTELSLHHQLLGPLYWFLFSIFVIFLALNLLIAVLTAPLAEVKETCDLHIIMNSKVQVEIQMDTTLSNWERKKLWVRESLLAFVNLVYDASPYPPLKIFALRLNQALRTLCTVHSHVNPRLACQAASDLLEVLDNDLAKIPFETRLANNVFKSNELDEYSLAFTLQSISAMTANSLVRDSRLEKALMLYDIHTTNTNKLQDRQEASREIAQKLSTPDGDDDIFGSMEKELPGPRKTPTDAAKITNVESVTEEAAGLVTVESIPEARPGTSEPDESKKARNPLAISDNAKDTNGNGQAGFSQVGASAEAVGEKNTVEANKTSMDVKSDAGSEAGDPPQFLFTKYMLKRLRKARLFAVQFVVLSIVFGWFFATGLTRDNSSAYLVGSVDEGIVKFPIVQGCDDEKCESAMSFRKGFLDTDNVIEWYDWMEKVFMRQMFLANDLNMTNGTMLYWDRRYSFDLPIKIRQVRPVNKKCNFPPNREFGKSIEARRQYLIDNYDCTARHEFSKEDMPVKENLSPHLSADMYKYQDDCPERRKIGYWGFFEMIYPCGGHIAEIYNKTQLQALLASKWIDNRTRLVSVTVTYRSGDVGVEHTLYTGLGAGGGAAQSSALATAVSENRTELDNMLIVVMVCLSMDAIIEVVSLVYQQITSKEHVELKISEIIPSRLLVIYAVVLVLPYIAYPSPAVNERVKLQLGLAALCLTYMATNVVFFPIAGLFSKQATLLFDTLARSARQIALIAPFYVIFIAALAYSGLLLFSTRSAEFSSIRFAIQAVSRGALGDLDKDSLAIPLPEMAEVYNIIFYAVILIMLANLVLAMVTSAAGDALGAPLSVELAERVCQAFNWHVMYGSLIEFFIAWNVWFLRRSSGSAADTYREMSTIATGDGKRLPYLSETLCVALGPNRANDVLTQLRLDSIASELYPSTMLMVLEQHALFCETNRIEEAMDDEQEQELLRTFESPTASFSVTDRNDESVQEFLDGKTKKVDDNTTAVGDTTAIDIE